MSDFIGLLLPLSFLLLGGFLLARYQMRQYRNYLAEHTAKTDELVRAQQLTLQAVDRQTLALERIAVAIEKSRQG